MCQYLLGESVSLPTTRRLMHGSVSQMVRPHPWGIAALKDFVAPSLKDVAGLYSAFDSFALPLFDKDHKVGATVRLKSPLNEPQRSRPFAQCISPRRE